MAFVMLRRRGLIFKLVVGIPIAWFSIIGFFVVMSGGGFGIPDSSNSRDIRETNINNNNNNNEKPWFLKDQEPVKERPVLEQPNPDRMKQQEQFRQQAMQSTKRPSPHHIENGGFLDGIGDKIRNLGVPGFGENKLSTQRLIPTANKDAPGELGKAVNIEKDKLSPEERKLFDQGFQRNAFNEYASDKISVHRQLPDVRDKECKSLQYAKVLPDTSVIICFHNEAWSVLVRTVHSVIDRSPVHLMKEIILVDDFSDMDHLAQPLDDYMNKLGKVKVVRTKRREGLIRARLLGASQASGTVLTYLDSHCECTEGWLEPLVARIGENKSNVVTPVIDVIDDETLRYQYSSAKSTSVGGFDWNLQFNWHSIPEYEKRRRKSDVDPVRSPTMAGGLFSISREFFEYIGTYDPGMDIWGGENLEMSFRVWMCGGKLEILPCSHVGHIFRKRSPYKWKSGINVVKKNSIRLAEVWMDHYKNYYYERFNYDLIWMCGGSLEICPCSHVGHIFRKRNPNAQGISGNFVKKNSIRLAEVWMDEYKNYYYERFNGNLGEFGDVSARKELRKKLQCKSFDWFIKNIYPDLFIPGEALASGAIRNKVHSMCLDSPVDSHSMNKPIKTWPCHNQGGNQYWMLSKGGEIRRDEGCVDYAGQSIMIYPCHSMKGNQEWIYGQDNTIRHKNTNTCIEISNDGKEVHMAPCTGTDYQIWYWKRKTPASENNNQRQIARR